MSLDKARRKELGEKRGKERKGKAKRKEIVEQIDQLRNVGLNAGIIRETCWAAAFFCLSGRKGEAVWVWGCTCYM